MKPKYSLRNLIFAGTVLLATSAAQAADFIWLGTSNTNGGNSVNWNPSNPTSSTATVMQFNNTSTGQSGNGFYIGSSRTVGAIQWLSGNTGVNNIKLSTGPNSGVAADLTISGGTGISVADGLSHEIGASSNIGSAPTGTLILGSALAVATTSGNLTISRPITGAFAINKTSGTGTLTLSGANTFGTATAGLTVSAGTVRMGSATYSTGNTSGVLLTVNTGGTFDLNGNSIQVGNFTGTGGTVLNNGTTARTFTIGGNSTGGGTYAGVIADNNNAGTGTIALAKTGTGTITLSGPNTYTGTTSLSGGTASTLVADNASALGVGGNITYSSGNGTIRYTANSAGTDWSTRFKNSTFGIGLDTNAQNVTLAGIIDSTNSGGLIKYGSGNLTLSNANTFTGTVSIDQGALVVGANAPVSSAGALGNSNLEVALGTAGSGSFAQLHTNGAFTVDRAIRLRTSNTTDAGSRILTIGGTTAHDSVFSGDIFLGSTGNASRGIVVTAITGGKVTFSGVIQNPTGQDAGEIADAAALTAVTKTGAGTVVLSNANTYTGKTTINNSGGTLKITNAGALSSGDVFIGAQGTNTGTLELELTGTNTLANNFTTNSASTLATVGAKAHILNTSGTNTISGDITLTGGGGNGTNIASNGGLLTLSGTITTTGGLASRSLSLGGSGNGVVSGAIIREVGQTLAVQKSGAGTWILSNNFNDYNSTTTVTAGTLIVNGNISTSSLTTVSSAATIGGSGTVGPLTVQTGGFVAPGNSPDTLDVAGNYIQAGTYNAEITGNTVGNGTTGYDQIGVVGSVNITGGSLAVAFSGGTYAVNDLLFILLNDGGDGITGTYTGFAQNATVTTFGGFEWKISYTAKSEGTPSFLGGNDIALMAVPEPNVAALIGAFGGILLLRRRR